MKGRSFASALSTTVLALLGAACGRPAPPSEPAISVASTLGGSAAGFLTALAPRAFLFPADHGPHSGFRNEWWYFTGNLTAAGDRRFGYQLTFFRSQLTPQPMPRPSAWGASEVFLGHFALTDVEAERFHAQERFARASPLGLAGATVQPFRVWVEGWEARGGRDLPPLTLHAEASEVAVELELAAGKPLVLQGDRGLSVKGPEPGNASYYYSLPRLPTHGTVRVGATTYAVDGSSWMDREWSTSALSPGTVGWDWLALQLDDGSEVMLYRLRQADGSATAASAGSLIAADGNRRALAWGDIELRESGWWISPRSGVRYPAGFALRLPGEDLQLTVHPLLPDQELNLAFRYWEGAVEIAGTHRGSPLGGRGYMELVGYDGGPLGR